jgi:uncharacterized protein YoxC
MKTLAIALLIFIITMTAIAVSANLVLDERTETIEKVVSEDYFIMNNVIYKCEGYFKGDKRAK